MKTYIGDTVNEALLEDNNLGCRHDNQGLFLLVREASPFMRQNDMLHELVRHVPVEAGAEVRGIVFGERHRHVSSVIRTPT